jgi:glycosyltransferase involved in cell wall biosynthesis
MSSSEPPNEYSKEPVIVVAHDYLTQSGGAERVVVELASALQPSYIITALYSPEATFFELTNFKVRVSFLNRVGAFRRDPRRALPFLALAWSRFQAIDADVVFCSSSGWSHGVRVRKGARKIVYCHNPPRWLYQTEDYLQDQPHYVRLALAALRPFLLIWDRRAARSADVYLANSRSVATRIRQAYGLDAIVVHPPIGIDPDGDQDPVPDLTEPFFLTVGRARGYKGTSTLIDAFNGMPNQRLVVVGSSNEENVPSNVRVLGKVSEMQLRWLYSSATALISVSREDFGLTPIEANAFGTPVLLLRAGGFLDSTIEGVSGLFIDEVSVDCIRRAVDAFPDNWDNHAIRQHAGTFSPHSFMKRIVDIVISSKETGTGPLKPEI